MVVESQQRPRERMVAFLGDDGHAVECFVAAGEAFDVLKQPDKQPDLAIIAWDVAGPMSGAELLNRLKQREVTFPRIVVNSVVNLEVSRAFELGAVDLLAKPIDGDRFRKAVGEALGDPKEVNPLVAKLRKRIIGDSPGLLDAVVKLAEAIESNDAPVLLTGESGVGKEIFARMIHQYGSPGGKEFEAINITVPEKERIESDLFGHEKGSFTGATAAHRGAFERAAKGTLFLDEIGDLELELQPKLLRAIDQRKFRRVGGTKELSFGARLVCATSRYLPEAVSKGEFRKDLYFRINSIELCIPPLRQRKEDLRALVEHFLGDSSRRVVRETYDILRSYSFPGNVRELSDIVSRAAHASKGSEILPPHLPDKIMREREGSHTDAELTWPESLLAMPRSEALRIIEDLFDRVYLPRRMEEAGRDLDRAIDLTGLGEKTYKRKLREYGREDLIGRRRRSDS